MDALCNGFKMLVSLNLHGCSGLTPEELGRIARERPLTEVRGNIPVIKKMSWIDLIGKDKAEAEKRAADKKGKKGKKGKKKKKK